MYDENGSVYDCFLALLIKEPSLWICIVMNVPSYDLLLFMYFFVFSINTDKN